MPLDNVPSAAPQSGLKDHPGKSLKLFDESHPYFPSDCSSCPFNSNKGRLKNLFHNRVKDCYNCQYIPYCTDRGKEKREIIEAAEKVRRKIENDKVMPSFRSKTNGKKKGGSRKTCDSLVSGCINRTRKVRKCLLSHCRHDYDMMASAYIWKNPQILEYIRESPLGEGKDMNTEKAQKNIKKKVEELGFTGFRVYRFSYKGRVFLVKMAIVKDRYEQFYSLCEE